MKLINYIIVAVASFALAACTSSDILDYDLKDTMAVTKSDDLETLEVKLETAGTLAEKLGDKKNTVQKLILSGPVDADDINVLRKMPLLESLDIKGVAFIESEKMYDTEWGKRSVIKNGIGQNMFGRLKLKQIVLPENLKIIGGSAFLSSSLENIIIPASIKTIENGAFESTKLVNIVIPSNVTELSDNVFALCGKLQSITLPDGLFKIGYRAFWGCFSLRSIELPQSLTNIDIDAFDHAGLQSITIPEGVTVIPSACFTQCESLQEVNLPSHLTEIGSSAFSNCISLKSIIIPGSVTKLGQSIFQKCTALASVTLPDNLKSISNGMFYQCTALKAIKLPSKLVSIGSNGLAWCKLLRYLDIPESVTSIGDDAFAGDYRLYAISVKGRPVIAKAIASDANTLVYLSDPNTDIHASIKNVIINGVASSITLNNKYDFFCPEAFKTQKITYTHVFNSKSNEFPIPGEAAGWVGLSLPFNVTSISHEDGRVLAPFNSGVPNAKPFWLRELTANGFENVTTMKACMPYVIAMPHNEKYDKVYNIEGKVTFMAADATNGIVVQETTYQKVEGPLFNFNPSYEKVMKNAATFVLNTYDTFEGHNYGSVFVRNLRDTNPFEAYVSDKNASTKTPAMFSIGGNAKTRSTHTVSSKPSIDDM